MHYAALSNASALAALIAQGIAVRAAALLTAETSGDEAAVTRLSAEITELGCYEEALPLWTTLADREAVVGHLLDAFHLAENPLPTYAPAYGLVQAGSGSGSGGTMVHNQLTGKQGGADGAFYHVSQALYEATANLLPLAAHSAELLALLFDAPTVSVAASPAGPFRVGSTVSTLTLTATPSLGSAASVTGYVWRRNGNVIAGTSAVNPQSGVTASATYNVVATFDNGDGTTSTASANVSVSFQYERFSFVAFTDLLAVGVSDATISSLLNALSGADRALATGRAFARTLTPTDQYAYTAWPAVWGSGTFSVNGFPTTGFGERVFSYTSPDSLVTSYRLTRSPYRYTGPTALVVT